MTIGIAVMCEEGDTFVIGTDIRTVYGKSPLPPNDQCGKMYDLPPFDLITCIAGSVTQTEAIFSELCNQVQLLRNLGNTVKLEHVRNALEFSRKKELRRLQECAFQSQLPISLYDWMAGKLPDGRGLDELALRYGRQILHNVAESFDNGLIVAGFAGIERIFLKGYKVRPVEETSSPPIHIIGYPPAQIAAMDVLIRRKQDIEMMLPRTLFHVHEAMLAARKFGNKLVGTPASYAIIRDRAARRPNGVARFDADSTVFKDWLRTYKGGRDTWALDTLLAQKMVNNQMREHAPRRTNRNLK